MIKIFTILAGIFGLTSAIFFNFKHIHPGFVFFALAIISFITALFLVLLSFSRKQNKRPNFSNYIPDPKRGLINRHNHNDRICPACKSIGIKTQMQLLDDGYWVCPHSNHLSAYDNWTFSHNNRIHRTGDSMCLYPHPGPAGDAER